MKTDSMVQDNRFGWVGLQPSFFILHIHSQKNPPTKDEAKILQWQLLEFSVEEEKNASRFMIMIEEAKKKPNK